MKRQNKGMILGFLAVVVFGLTLPATRLLTNYFDPVFIGLGRACVAAAMAALILLFSRPTLPTKSQIKQLAIVALGIVIGFPVLSAVAMQTLPSSHGGVVLGFLPLATVIASRIVSDERPSLGFWITAIIGSAVVVSYSLLQGGGHFMLGDLALALAILCGAFGYAVGGELSKELGGWQVICWALVLSVPFIIIPSILTFPSLGAALPIQVIIAFVYLSLGSQLFGFFLWYKAMVIGGVARVSQIQLLQPFITLIAAALMLGEAIESKTIGFAIAIVLLVAIAKRMPVHTSDPTSVTTKD